MFLKRETRIGAAVAIVAMLALGVAAPAGAAGWTSWGEAREWSGGIVPRVLSWLGLGPSVASLKCDHGSQIDPNGCPRTARSDDGASIDPDGLKLDDGAHIDPNGLLTKSDQGSQIDPDGKH